MLLLLSSLDKLATDFNIGYLKGIYSYYFPTEDNLEYIGEVTTYEYFDKKKVSLNEYNNYKSKFNNNRVKKS